MHDRTARPSAAQTANLLGALATVVSERSDTALADAAEIRGRETEALLAVDTWRGSPIGFLADVLAVTHSGAVRLVDRLEARGLVERAPGQDGRTAYVQPTPAGRRTVRRMRRGRARQLGGLLESLSSDERLQLHGLLERLLRSDERTRTEARHDCRVCDHSICRGPACPVGASVVDGR